MDLLKTLSDNKEAILLAEFAAFLHDLDKLRGKFLNSPNAHSFKDRLHVVMEPSKEDNGRLRKVLRNKEKHPTPAMERRIIWDGYEFRNISADINPPLNDLLTLDGELDLREDLRVDISGAFIYHHDNDPTPENLHPLTSYLIHGGYSGCDVIDSLIDKNATQKQQGKQFHIDTPFGTFSRYTGMLNDPKSEKFHGDAVKTVRTHLAENPKPIDSYTFTREDSPNGLKHYLKEGLGGTQYPCNDVMLWSHSYSVASLSKAVLAKVLIEYNYAKACALLPYILPQIADRIDWEDGSAELRPRPNQTDFAYCRVTLDRPYLYSRALRAKDVMGMASEVDSLLLHVERVFETEILAGNQVYRDQDRVIFVIPRLSTWTSGGVSVLPEHLQADFVSEIKTKLTKTIDAWLEENDRQELPYDISFYDGPIPDEPDVGRRMIDRSKLAFETKTPCNQSVPLLTKLNAESGPACAVCGLRRATRLEPGNNDNLCGSCHKRRKLELVKSLRTDVDGEGTNKTSNLDLLLKKFPNENRLALIRIEFDLSPLYESTIFDKVQWKDRSGRPQTKHPSPGRLHRSWNVLTEFLDWCQNVATKPMGMIFPITLTPTPDRMEFVGRGAMVMEIVTTIYNEYEKRFGKFRDRLPLSIGAVFFYQKFPLYVVMDAVRSMSSRMRQAKPETWTVTGKSQEGNLGYRLSLRPERYRQRGTLAAWTNWFVSDKLSGGETDVFHPQFKVQCDGATSLKLIHAAEEAEGVNCEDGLEVYEGHFDFVLADSAQSRIAFHDDGRRHHILGSRPVYPLSSIREFARLWSLFNKAHITPSQLNAIEGAIADKMMSWKERWFSEVEQNEEAVLRYCEIVLFSPNAFGARKKDGTYRHWDESSNLPASDPDYENSEKALLLHAARTGVLLDVIDLYRHLQGTPLTDEKARLEADSMRLTHATA